MEPGHTPRPGTEARFIPAEKSAKEAKGNGQEDDHEMGQQKSQARPEKGGKTLASRQASAHPMERSYTLHRLALLLGLAMTDQPTAVPVMVDSHSQAGRSRIGPAAFGSYSFKDRLHPRMSRGTRSGWWIDDPELRQLRGHLPTRL